MTMWDPYRELQALRREFDRAFASDAGTSGSPPRWRFAFLPGRAARMYPLVNLHDDGENFFVEALMPGVDPDKVEVTVLGNSLTISGQKTPVGDVADERVHRMERAAGRFMRTIQLPTEIERDQVNAEYRNGLLLLTLPRSEASKPRRVQIQAGGDLEGEKSAGGTT
jgi:HSP20 family protein